MTSPGRRIVCWFSCGTSSAIAAKLTLADALPSDEIRIVRIHVPEEHADNLRFAADCEAWFGQPIITVASLEYDSCEDVWTRRGFMSGPHGAVCSIEMKKAVRWVLEQDWQPDIQVFGYDAGEADRAAEFRRANPDVSLVTPLIDRGLTKEDCHAIIDRVGIQLPITYRLGFNNANCLGCVRAQAPSYWNRVRRHFPDVFASRATLSRALGCRLVKLTKAPRERLFLDELPPEMDVGDADPRMDCSLLCHLAEQDISRLTLTNAPMASPPRAMPPGTSPAPACAPSDRRAVHSAQPEGHQ